MHVIGEIEGRNCVIMDDMIDTAGTLVKAAEVLKERGAKHVYAYCTHAVFSGPAIERIKASHLDEVVITNTIPLNDAGKACPKIRQLSVAFLFAETIRRISDGESVTSSRNRTTTSDPFRWPPRHLPRRPFQMGRLWSRSTPTHWSNVMEFVAFERKLQGTGASRRLQHRQGARHRLRGR
jgi:hypothetical protein